MPRTSQQSSFPGWRLYPCRLPSSWALACFSIFFICPLLPTSLSPDTPFTLSSSLFFYYASVPFVLLGTQAMLFRVFVTWQDSPVVWPVLNYLYSSMGLWDVACPGAFQ